MRDSLKFEKVFSLFEKIKKWQNQAETFHIWILLLHSLQFLDFYNGEIDCPTPKRFNSPFTRNWILIFDWILSDN